MNLLLYPYCSQILHEFWVWESSFSEVPTAFYLWKRFDPSCFFHILPLRYRRNSDLLDWNFICQGSHIQSRAEGKGHMQIAYYSNRNIEASETAIIQPVQVTEQFKYSKATLSDSINLHAIFSFNWEHFMDMNWLLHTSVNFLNYRQIQRTLCFHPSL